MRIGFDARFLHQPGSGVYRYLANLFHWLPEVAPGNDYFLYRLQDRASVRPEIVPDRFVIRHVPGPPSLYSFSPGLFQAQQRDRLDLFHATAYTVPLIKVCPTVLTIHDLTFEVHPEWYGSWRGWAFRRFIRRSAWKADRIIADSEATRNDLHRYYGLPPERMVAIPLAAGPEFAPINKTAAKEEVRRELGLAGPFLLYVGALHERKNVKRLIAAYGLARQSHSLEHRLVIVGAGSSAQQVQLERSVLAAGLGDAVIRLPPVSDRLLPWLYAAAEAFIYPSLYEGFGLPVLEAMASGTPVIASHSSALAEVVGTAGVLVDPGDTSDIARAIGQVLDSPELRAELSARGLQRARLFSWEACARQTAEVYGSVLTQGRDGSR